MTEQHPMQSNVAEECPSPSPSTLPNDEREGSKSKGKKEEKKEDTSLPVGDDGIHDSSNSNSNSNTEPTKGIALVFGASGEEGRAVASGLIESGYGPVYGATRDVATGPAVEASNLGCVLLEIDPADEEAVEDALVRTGASVVFFVTTTEMPRFGQDDDGDGDGDGDDDGGEEMRDGDVEGSGSTRRSPRPRTPPPPSSFKEAEERECAVIKGFFDALLRAHAMDGRPRHVVFSTQDDVGRLNEDDPFLEPLEDGSVCAHYSGKGRGGRYGLSVVRDVPGLTLTLVALPFLHSNFLGFAIPLPDEAMTQWTIELAFGDAEIDMFSASDLSSLIPAIFDDRDLYGGFTVRASAERTSMRDVAAFFSDLFGKDVIYNPLTTEEMAALSIPHAPALAQMCRYLSDPRSAHDVELTDAIMFPRKPRLFKDWLLTHNDHPAFDKVGLTSDPGPILSVTVFGATSLEGTSVVKGLLADNRKSYRIRATTRDETQEKAKALKALDPDRVELVWCNFDDVDSCAGAADGVDGAFLVTDYFEAAGMDPDVELRHAKNVIDACESSRTVRHLVFSTMEDIEEMDARLKLNLPALKGYEEIEVEVEVDEDVKRENGTTKNDDDNKTKGKTTAAVEASIGDEKKTTTRKKMMKKKKKRVAPPQFDAKAKAAAYARTKKLSCTYVLMPVYTEHFFEMLAPELRSDDVTGEKTVVMHVPKGGKGIGADGDEPRVMCMSVDELGPAVANIFDSYQVYAGHEIGLVTDFVTISEVAEMITEVFFEETDDEGNVTKSKVEKKDVKVDAWVEKKDTVVKDFGQMFSYYSKTNAVRLRRSVAKTLQLVPDAKPMKEWLERNRHNVAFRQRLGLR